MRLSLQLRYPLSVMHMQPPRLSRRAYLEWLEEQVENFKDSVPRSELLRIADEAVEELRVNHEGQYQLTEMLLWEAVDRKIIRQLGLPGYRAWCAATVQRSAESAPEPGASV